MESLSLVTVPALRARLAPQSLEMHEPKMREAQNGEEDVLEGGEPGLWCLYTLDRGECSYTSLGAEVLGKLLCAGSSLVLQLRTAMMHSICFPGLEDQLSMENDEKYSICCKSTGKKVFFNPSKFLVYFYLYLGLIGI